MWCQFENASYTQARSPIVLCAIYLSLSALFLLWYVCILLRWRENIGVFGKEIGRSIAGNCSNNSPRDESREELLRVLDRSVIGEGCGQ